MHEIFFKLQYKSAGVALPSISKSAPLFSAVLSFSKNFSNVRSGSTKWWTNVLLITRSSHPEVFLRKSVLKICSKFTGEHPCRSVFLIKLISRFIEITLRRGCSPVNFLHIFKTPFPRNTFPEIYLSLRGDLLQVLINSTIFATFTFLFSVLLCHNLDSSMLKSEGSLT